MMNMLNTITIQGRLIRSPELKATASGVSCTTFTLACEQDYKKQDGERDTDFLDVVAWRGAAEFVHRNFKKGQMAIVRGRLQTRQWTADDGSKRKAVQIVAENIYFCGDKNANARPMEERNELVEESGFTPVETDELPF